MHSSLNIMSWPRFVPLGLAFGGALASIFVESMQTVYVITPLATFSCLSFFVAFPQTAESCFQRSTTLEDLDSDSEDVPATLKAYQKDIRRTFILSMTFISSLSFGAVVDYTLFRHSHSHLNTLEFIGVCGRTH